MDMLHNQLNQIMMIVQYQSKDPTASTSGINNFPAAGTHSFTFSQAKRSKFIASCLSSNQGVWIIDSGATDHIYISLTNMHHTYTCHTPILVGLPNGQTTSVTTIGSVTLNENITLNNVFHIPSFTFNLISVSRLLTNKYTSITFTHNTCIFQAHDQKLAHGLLCNGLYLLPTSASPFTPRASPVYSNKEDVHLWHARLGHPSILVLKHIKFLLSTF